MHDQPSILELVEAVRDFLETKAMPQLEGRAAFHARVSANALGIVERQLALGPKQAADEIERLKKLLGRDDTLDELNRALCSAIREGEIGLESPGLADHLWETTLAKVAVDQPKYATYQKTVREYGDGHP